MMQSLGERVLDELESDIKLRRRLAELLIREPDLRLALVNAALATVATREDIRELRAEMNQLRAEINQLRAEMNQLRNEVKEGMNQLRNEVREEVNQLRNGMREEISQLRGEVAQLRAEMSSNLRWTIGTMLAIWGATVIPILLRLIGML